MSNSAAVQSNARTESPVDYDAVIMGAGFGGIRSLYELRKMGLSVKILDGASDVGGAWYWNRYPGARFDSESYSYAYSFSQDLLQEWNWTEHYSGQPENEKYLNFVADKFALRRKNSAPGDLGHQP